MSSVKMRSACPIASSLEIIGDRWTLVLVRDMVNGKSKFNEFLNSPEKITPSVLKDRLTQMEADGLIERKPYSARPPRFEYQLTSAGKGLLGVMQALCLWGNATIDGTWIAPESFMKKVQAL
jgi:DNA-binding HxlR family transcriptional regulator